jgi:hypothetical protein
MGLRHTAKEALKKPVGPFLRVLDRRFDALHAELKAIDGRTDHLVEARLNQLAQDVNTDLETIAELVLTFERFALEFTERSERTIEILEALLSRLNSPCDPGDSTSSLGSG